MMQEASHHETAELAMWGSEPKTKQALRKYVAVAVSDFLQVSSSEALKKLRKQTFHVCLNLKPAFAGHNVWHMRTDLRSNLKLSEAQKNLLRFKADSGWLFGEINHYKAQRSWFFCVPPNANELDIDALPVVFVRG
jgi:hypothetical protein